MMRDLAVAALASLGALAFFVALLVLALYTTRVA